MNRIVTVYPMSVISKTFVALVVTSLMFLANAQESKLLAHWSFDESANGIFTDKTGNGYDAVSSGLAIADGVAGKALVCPGTSFDCAVKNSSGNFTMEKFSVEALYYAAANPSGDQIIFNYNKVTSGIRNGYDMHVSSNGIIDFDISSLDGSAWIEAFSTTAVTAGKWYHLTGTYDGTNLCLYVNGKLERSVAYRQQGIREPETSFRIGCTMRMEGNLAFFADAKIDEMKVYNYALAADTVAAHFGAYDIPGSTVTTPKLLAHWSFDSIDNGSSYFDNSGNGYTAKTAAVKRVDGVRGKALDCNDDVFEVRVPNSAPDFSVEQFTIEGWIYSYIDLANPGSFYNYKGIFNYVKCGMEGSGYTGGYSLQISDKGRLFTSISTPAGGAWNACESDEILLPRTWYHVAGTYDKTTLRLFINGRQVKQVVAAGGYLVPGNIPACIGAQFQVTDTVTNAGRIRTRFNGKIDELKVYNFPLDAQTIKSTFESLKPPAKPQFEINLGMKTTFAQPGDTVVMPVYIANHEDYTISALQLSLRYDPSKLALLSVSKDSGIVKSLELFSWNGTRPGFVPVAMAGTTVRLGYGEGELFRCVFVVAASVDNGDTCEVGIDSVSIDESNNLIVSTTQSGQIIISRQTIIYGDVTGNGEVSVVDAQQVLKYVVGALPLPDAVCCPNFTTAVADVSGNGTITSYDAAMIFQYSLGLIPVFPVEKSGTRQLAKRGAATDQKALLSFAHNSDYHDAVVYDLVGSNMAGFYAGEFAIVCDAPAELLSKSTITTDVRGATLSSRYSADDHLLRVAVSSNDDIDHDGPIAIVRITLPPSQQSVPGFSVKTALINEGAITTDFTSNGLVGLLSTKTMRIRAAAELRVAGNLLSINRRTAATAAMVTVWDLHGRMVIRQVVSGARATVDIGKFGKGTYIVQLHDGTASTTNRLLFMNKR